MEVKTKIVFGGGLGLLLLAAAAFIWGQASQAQSINIPNGDELKAWGSAWTNGNIKQAITGTSQLMGIGGNNGIPQIPAVEIASSQAINGYGPGDYIFTPNDIIPDNHVNQAFADAVEQTYYFQIEDLTHPYLSPSERFYAGSDVYTISGCKALRNPYSNPYWYGPGQYVHLHEYALPSIKITSVIDPATGKQLYP